VNKNVSIAASRAAAGVGDSGAAAPVATPALPRRTALASAIGALAAAAVVPAIAAPASRGTAIAVGAVPPPELGPAPGGWISGLGRTIAALWREHDRLDTEETVTADAAQRAGVLRRMNLVAERAQVLSLTALGGRASSWADAAAQAALADEQLGLLAASDLADHLGARERAVIEAVRRAMISIALLSAAASAQDLGQLGPLDFDLEAERFFPEAATPPAPGRAPADLFVRVGELPADPGGQISA
jgi:hypothetical protein